MRQYFIGRGVFLLKSPIDGILLYNDILFGLAVFPKFPHWHTPFSKSVRTHMHSRARTSGRSSRLDHRQPGKKAKKKKKANLVGRYVALFRSRSPPPHRGKSQQKKGGKNPKKKPRTGQVKWVKRFRAQKLTAQKEEIGPNPHQTMTGSCLFPGGASGASS